MKKLLLLQLSAILLALSEMYAIDTGIITTLDYYANAITRKEALKHNYAIITAGEKQLLCAYLREINLSELDLNDVDLTLANLIQANLFGASLKKAKLIWADLRFIILDKANLHQANLKNANLREASLRGSNLSKADLEKADLRFANLCGANLVGANLTNTKLDNIKIDHSTIRYDEDDTSDPEFHNALWYAVYCREKDYVHQSAPITLLTSIPSTNLISAVKKLFTRS